MPTNSSRTCNILNWNIRGLNAQKKWLALHKKIEESDVDIIRLQETKKITFLTWPRSEAFFHSKFNDFSFVPSIGASGGLLISWNGSNFEGEVLF